MWQWVMVWAVVLGSTAGFLSLFAWSMARAYDKRRSLVVRRFKHDFFVVSPRLQTLIESLHDAGAYRDDVTRMEHAILLQANRYRGVYLCANGDIVYDYGRREYMEPSDKQTEPQEWDVYAALALAAERYEQPTLRQLLPPQPINVEPCETCAGKGSTSPSTVCRSCAGVGWDYWDEAKRTERGMLSTTGHHHLQMAHEEILFD